MTSTLEEGKLRLREELLKCSQEDAELRFLNTGHVMPESRHLTIVLRPFCRGEN